MDALAVQSTWGAALGRRLVRRSRLLEGIARSDRRTVLVVAPAGYGKTTLARQWIDEVDGRWIGLSPANADVPVLARDLTAALTDLADLDPTRVEAALSAGKTSLDQARNVAHTILAQVVNPLDRWIVLDDYHFLVANPPAEDLIGLLVRSGKFKLMVGSRVSPSWATSRHRVHLETFEIGQSELAMDDDEVAELIPPSARTKGLNRRARGWPAVIGLAAHVDTPDLPPDLDNLSARLYDYFAEELYEHASEGVRGFLTTLAVLPPLATRELDDVLHGEDVGERVAATGLAYESDGRILIHPLAQEFLRSKLRGQGNATEVVNSAFELTLTRCLYDEAFGLIQDFALVDRLEELIAAAYAALNETGRIVTLESFGSYAEKHGGVSQRMLDLVAAEVALRDGRFEHAYSLGKAAGDALPADHPLKAHSYVIAGSAAHLMSRFEEALEIHSLASQHAIGLSDCNDAAWGTCIAALLAEDIRAKTFLRELERMPDPRPSDRVRTEVARIRFNLLAGAEGLRTLNLKTRADSIAAVTEPWVRSGWSSCHGYALVLQGRYEEARSLLKPTLAELQDFRLPFATPHVELLLAASELGLRHFGRADILIGRVERSSSYSRDVFLQLNVRSLRARLCLAQSHLSEALALTADDFERYGSRAMYGEYLATRSLALAVAGATDAARSTADRAEAVTRAIDTRMICSAVRAIVSDGSRASDVATIELLDDASTSGVWDGLVCCIRAAPKLLNRIWDEPHHRVELREVLLRSNDVALAKSVGLANRSSGPRGVLSPREREVLDQVRQGRTNAEIAATLFISPGTVKRHMDHVFDKLGVRTRAAAVARYAEIETTEAGSESASTDAS